MAKETDITVEEARGLVSDRHLWPRVRDFLWNFAPQVHASWVEDLFSGIGAEAQSGMESPRVKRYVLESLGIEPCFHTFPREDGSRLLLLDGATLESVAKWIGALACAKKLRGVTSGADVRALKAALPGIYPDVFGYVAYFEGSEIEDLGFKIEEGRLGEIGRLGVHILLSLLDSLPASLVARLKLKLPKTYSDQSSILNPQSSIFNQKSLTRLLKLKFPEAYSLCCS
jgi:hypothetical protein